MGGPRKPLRGTRRSSIARSAASVSFATVSQNFHAFVAQALASPGTRRPGAPKSSRWYGKMKMLAISTFSVVVAYS